MALELPDGWRDQLPDDIKTNGVLDDVTSIDQMAKMVVNGRQLQTHQISIPSEDASPEKREEFLKDLQSKIPDLVYVGEDADLSNVYDRMGRPKEPTEYELPEIPDPLKDNFAGLAAKAHEVGVSNKQLKALSETILGDYETNVNTSVANLEATKQEVSKLYGEATPEKLEQAANFAKQLGFTDDFSEAIKEGVVGVENLKAFDKIMEGFESPGPRIGDEQGATGFSHLTPDQAEIQLSEIMGNKEHPYWDGASPAHDSAVKKVVELTRQADAGKQQTETEKFRDALAGRG